jgi:hypothetical protein
LLAFTFFIFDAGIWLEMLESIKSNNADRVNIVILDACHKNSLIGLRKCSRKYDAMWAKKPMAHRCLEKAQA